MSSKKGQVRKKEPSSFARRFWQYMRSIRGIKIKIESGERIFSNDLDEAQVICETNGNINGANIGDQAPDFELEVVANGNGYFQLSDYLGQVVVLAFFAPM